MFYSLKTTRQAEIILFHIEDNIYMLNFILKTCYVILGSVGLVLELLYEQCRVMLFARCILSASYIHIPESGTTQGSSNAAGTTNQKETSNFDEF